MKTEHLLIQEKRENIGKASKDNCNYFLKPICITIFIYVLHRNCNILDKNCTEVPNDGNLTKLFLIKNYFYYKE